MQEFIKKIIKIQSTLNAPKNQYNSFGKYYYRSCEDILEALKPLLRNEGLVQTITDDLELIGDRYYVKATVKVSDGTNTIENTAYAREEDVKKGMDASQITGTASSYARKYSLNGMWCIDDNKDADTDEHHQQTERVPEAAVAKQQQPRNTKPHGITAEQITVLSEAIIHKGYTVPDACISFGVNSLAEVNPSVYNGILDTVLNEWPHA